MKNPSHYKEHLKKCPWMLIDKNKEPSGIPVTLNHMHHIMDFEPWLIY